MLTDEGIYEVISLENSPNSESLLPGESGSQIFPFLQSQIINEAALDEKILHNGKILATLLFKVSTSHEKLEILNESWNLFEILRKI